MKNLTDLTPIIEAVLTLVIAVFSAIIIPWIKKTVTPLLEQKLTDEQRKELQTWVNAAVWAAEQTITGDNKGEERKASVLDFLAERGYTVDTKEVDNLIEAAVKQLKLEEKKKEG